MEGETPIPTFRLDPSLEQPQIEGLRAVRAARNQEEVAAKLGRLEQAARGGDNLLPLILDAAASYATVGEYREN